jgi:hypothetical protein
MSGWISSIHQHSSAFCHVVADCIAYFIPLPAQKVQQMRDQVEPLERQRLYGAWFERIVTHDAHAAVLRTAERYLSALQQIPD